MLDRDLAELCGVEARVLNQAVRRNIKRFPEDFMFSLTREEIRPKLNTPQMFSHSQNRAWRCFLLFSILNGLSQLTFRYVFSLSKIKI